LSAEGIFLLEFNISFSFELGQFAVQAVIIINSISKEIFPLIPRVSLYEFGKRFGNTILKTKVRMVS
tara:strand:+ start:291 stop:491 length:201 start_codon:yes stop_codon:yes gene_type:complete